VRSTNGFTFGGYAAAAWHNSGGGFIAAAGSFVFWVENPQGRAPGCLDCVTPASALYSGQNSAYGPFLYGGGNGVDFACNKINLYGTDGSALYQLYANNTANVSSIIQTALMPMNDPIRDKQALKFGVEATTSGNTTTGTVFTITVDSQQGSSPPYTLQNTVIWTNNAGATITWINNSSTVISWLYNTGYYLYKSDAQQWGKYLGLTLQSNSAAFVVNTFEFEHELRARF
jgi:hypothetical protein